MKGVNNRTGKKGGAFNSNNQKKRLNIQIFVFGFQIQFSIVFYPQVNP